MTVGALTYSWLKALAVNGAVHLADFRFFGLTLAGSKST